MKTKATTGQKLTAGVLLAGTALGAWASPASAENLWTSHIGDPNVINSGWLTGTHTRTWHDNHNDNAATTFGLSECHNEFGALLFNATFQLERNNWFGGSTSKGARTFTCTNPGPGTKSYGEQGDGDFYLSLTQLNGGNGGGGLRLMAQDVKTKY